jgi:hypothetical protein
MMAPPRNILEPIVMPDVWAAKGPKFLEAPKFNVGLL